MKDKLAKADFKLCASAFFCMKIVLASASPRRSQLLNALGLEFSVQPSPTLEPAPTRDDGQNPGAFVERLARLKAQNIASDASNELVDELILAADTVVELDGEILGKPRDEADAIAMLTRLRGQTHRVYSGICLQRGETIQSAHEITRVTFGEFSDDFIAAYVATGEPLDKAGSYGAQGRGALLVSKIEGDYWNVVGLPLFRLSRMLREFGVWIEASW